MICKRLGFRLAWASLLAGLLLGRVGSSGGSEQPPLGKNEVRCGSESCTLGACLSQALLENPSEALGKLRLVPVSEKGVAVGFKLLGLRADMLAARAGLQNGDVVMALNGHSLAGPQEAMQALAAVRQETLIRLSLRRSGQVIERRLLLDRREVAAGECPAAKRDTVPPATGTPPTGNPAGKPQGTAVEGLARDISCSGTRCKLKNGVLDRVLADQTLLMQGARLVPAMVDGKAQGLKVFGIRPGSVYRLVGLENGDQIERIAGQPIASPESALVAYSKIRESGLFTVELRRRGAPLALSFEVER